MKFIANKGLFISPSVRQFLTLLSLFIVNLIVRGWNNTDISLSRDEPFTVYFSQLSLGQFVPIILNTNNPPTFEVLLHYWVLLFGNDIRTLRWLPTIIMSLGAMPMFLLGKRLGGLSGAVMASLLFLGSSILMNVSHLDRAYCILITGSIYMCYLFVRIFEKGNRFDQLLWSLTAIITCYSHYFGWITVATLWFAVLTIGEFRRETLRKMTFATSILLVCYLPLILYLIHRFSVTQAELEASHFTLSAHRLTALLGEFLNGDQVTLAFSIVGLGIGFYLISKKNLRAGTLLLLFCLFFIITSRITGDSFSGVSQQLLIAILFCLLGFCIYFTANSNSSPTKKVLLYWAIVPLSVGFTLSYNLPIFVDRYFSFTAPAILMLVVVLLHEIQHTTRRITTYGLLFAIYVWHFESLPKYDVDHRPAVYAFRDYHAMTDLSIVGPGYFDFDFAYYFDKAIFYNGANHMSDTLGTRISFDNSYVSFKEGLRRELRRNRIIISNDSSSLQIDTTSIKRVAFFDGNFSLAYPNNGILQYLEKRYGPPSQSNDFSGLFKIYVFTK